VPQTHGTMIITKQLEVSRCSREKISISVKLEKRGGRQQSFMERITRFETTFKQIKVYLSYTVARLSPKRSAHSMSFPIKLHKVVPGTPTTSSERQDRHFWVISYHHPDSGEDQSMRNQIDLHGRNYFRGIRLIWYYPAALSRRLGLTYPCTGFFSPPQISSRITARALQSPIGFFYIHFVHQPL